MSDSVVSIRYNSKEEMLSIAKDSKEIFSGNYWDFPSDPDGISDILEKLGLKVELKEDLESVDLEEDED